MSYQSVTARTLRDAFLALSLGAWSEFVEQVKSGDYDI